MPTGQHRYSNKICGPAPRSLEGGLSPPRRCTCECRGTSCSIGVLVLFFFQAEDGIRDTSMTGVQTCALPISNSDAAPVADLTVADFEVLDDGRPVAIQSVRFLGASQYSGDATLAPIRTHDDEERSEERRVGKECSTGGEAEP